MICTRFHLHAKVLEYSIEISAHGVLKGYRMKYKAKCEYVPYYA